MNPELTNEEKPDEPFNYTVGATVNKQINQTIASVYL